MTAAQRKAEVEAEKRREDAALYSAVNHARMDWHNALALKRIAGEESRSISAVNCAQQEEDRAARAYVKAVRAYETWKKKGRK